MPEVRSNPITGDWVIIATERARRPEEFARKTPQARARRRSRRIALSAQATRSRTPAEQFRVPAPDGGWLVRAVPNRFAALTPEGASSGTQRVPDAASTASGSTR